MKRKPFTLFEVLVAMVLITLFSGVGGWQMHKAMGKKRFKSDLARLEARLRTSQKMAISMQADWRGTLQKEGVKWVFESRCEEVEQKRLSPLHLESLEIFLNGKKIETLTFDFFANGHISPQGKVVFQRGEETEEWKTAELFLREQGKKLGPQHPND